MHLPTSEFSKSGLSQLVTMVDQPLPLIPKRKEANPGFRLNGFRMQMKSYSGIRRISKSIIGASAAIFFTAVSGDAPVKSQDRSLEEIVTRSAWYFTNLTRPNLQVDPPRFRVALRGEIIPDGCISRPLDSTVYGSHYCPATKTIVLEIAQVESIRRRHGSGGVAYVVAHEYAHFMQDYAGIVLPEPYQELHADCMAASLLLGNQGHAIRTLGINADDVRAMAETAFSAGGGATHGTSEQRLRAVAFGAKNTLLDCDAFAGVRRSPSVSANPQAGQVATGSRTPTIQSAPITNQPGFSYIGTAPSWDGTTTPVYVSELKADQDGVLSMMIKTRMNSISPSLQTQRAFVDCRRGGSWFHASDYMKSRPDMGWASLVRQKYCK